MAGVKRSRESYGSKPGGPKLKQENPTAAVVADGPFIPMFLKFRDELDEHHERRERVIKASRDITAISKKMIFTLQRARPSPSSSSTTLPPSITKELHAHETKIHELLRSVSADLQGINSYRYGRQISGALQEYIEALSFRHYIRFGRLITLEEAAGYVSGKTPPDAAEGKVEVAGMDVDVEGEKSGKKLKKDSPPPPPPPSDIMDTTPDQPTPEKEKEEKGEKLEGVLLPESDFILGIFDLVGEIMRFAITSIATTPISNHDSKSVPDIPVLRHLREMRAGFESLDATGFLGGAIAKKMDVMRTCVEKVEIAMYGRIVRGSERPEGWVMTGEDTGWEGREEKE